MASLGKRGYEQALGMEGAAAALLRRAGFVTGDSDDGYEVTMKDLAPDVRASLELMARALSDLPERDPVAMVWPFKAFCGEWVPGVAASSDEELVRAYGHLRMLEVQEREVLAAALAQRVLRYAPKDPQTHAAMLSQALALALARVQATAYGESIAPGDPNYVEVHRSRVASEARDAAAATAAATDAALLPAGSAPLWLLGGGLGAWPWTSAFVRSAMDSAMHAVVTQHEAATSDDCSAGTAVRRLLALPMKYVDGCLYQSTGLPPHVAAQISSGALTAALEDELQMHAAVRFGHTAPSRETLHYALEGGHFDAVSAMLPGNMDQLADAWVRDSVVARSFWEPMYAFLMQALGGDVDPVDFAFTMALHEPLTEDVGATESRALLGRLMRTLAGAHWTAAQQGAFVAELGRNIVEDHDVENSVAWCAEVLRAALQCGFQPDFLQVARAAEFNIVVLQRAAPVGLQWTSEYVCGAARLGNTAALCWLEQQGAPVTGNVNAAASAARAGFIALGLDLLTPEQRQDAQVRRSVAQAYSAYAIATESLGFHTEDAVKRLRP